MTDRSNADEMAEARTETPVWSAGTAVVALGGNALAPAGEPSTIYDQFRYARESLGPIVDLALAGWSVCVVHGNGPQVGDELVRNELARYDATPLPLGVLVAATAGWIGYMIQQSVDNALRRADAPRDVATVITQVVVDPNDPALRNPTKFIGRELPPERVEELRREGFSVKEDGNGRLRRVVGSPKPTGIHELPSIRRLLDAGSIVIACGGGGAPIYDDPRLGWEGIDAVVDKDLAAAVLARDLEADLLLILTDVDAVYADWGTPEQRPIRRMSADEAVQMDRDGAFGEGSMAPKIRAAVDFARRTGGRAVITALNRGREAVRGEAGTTITATSEQAESV
jgi:carbamate kinase